MTARFKVLLRLWLVLPPLLAAATSAQGQGPDRAGARGAGLTRAEGTAYELYAVGVGFGVAILPRDWTRGAQQLRLQAGLGRSGRVLATGSVSAAGSVRLTLPPSVPTPLRVDALNAPPLPEGVTRECSGQLRSSDGAASLTEGHLVFGDGEPLFPLRSTEDLLDYDYRNSLSGFLIYADRATTISGERSCIFTDPQGEDPFTLRERWKDVSLVRGWNALRQAVVTAASPAQADATLTAIPSPAAWFAFEKRR